MKLKTMHALKMAIRPMTLLVVLALMVVASQTGFALDPKLSGQVELKNKDIVESAYNLNNGSLVFLLTPAEKNGDDDRKSDGVAPLYIIVYPNAVSATIGTTNCQHQPADNCPDHGPVFAGLAESTEPTVYASGVWGHDHVGPFPNRRGEHSFITWVPVAVMFTSLDKITHITTVDQLRAAEKAGDVTEIVLWDAAFNAGQTNASVYLKGTPVEPGPNVP